MLGGLNLRRTGWVLAILGLGAAVILLLASAWFSRKNSNAFNVSVGWANIASMTVGAIGVIVIMADKVGALSNLSPMRMAEIADDIAQEAMRQDGLLLAQLLSTDTLDSRAARGNFRLGKPYDRRKSRGKRSRRAVREFAEVVDFYLDETRGRMVILGAPGTGKTVLAVSLTVGLLKRRARASASQGQTMPVPCLFNLPSWDPAGHDLTEWLEAQIVDRFRLGRKIAARLVHDRWIIPVLDGLDEMDSEEVAPRRSQGAVLDINDYIARTPGSQVVVVCRSGAKYYQRLVRGVRDADEITVQNLNPQQIIGYIKTQCPDEVSLGAWQSVFDALEDRNSSPILSVLDTPWRMTAAVTFALFGGEPAMLLPGPAETAGPSWHAGYSSRISKLLMEAFIASRILSRRNRKRRISITKTLAQLRAVADLLTRMESSGRGGKEIVLHQWWKAFNERKVLRSHVLITWAALHFPFGVLGFFLTAHTIGRNKDWITGVAVLSNYFTILAYGSWKAATRKGPITLRIGSLRSARRAGMAAIGIVVSGLFGVLAALAYGTLYGIGSGAISATLMTLFTASSGLDPVDATRPMATLDNDRNFAIIIGIAIGAYATLYYVTLYGFAVALTFASMCLLGSVFSSAYVRYLVAVYFGGRRGLPLRFADFLNWCHSAGILRVSGIGYQFRHQELLDYLTRVDDYNPSSSEPPH
jgi:hypothetical protein